MIKSDIMLHQKFGKLRGFLVTVKAVIDYTNQSSRKGGNQGNFPRKNDTFRQYARSNVLKYFETKIL